MKPKSLRYAHERIEDDETLSRKEKAIATFLICREIYFNLINYKRLTTEERKILIFISKDIHIRSLSIVNSINHSSYEKLRNINKLFSNGKVKDLTHLNSITKAFYEAILIHLVLDEQNNTYEKFCDLLFQHEIIGQIHVATETKILKIILKIIKNIEIAQNQVQEKH